MNDDARLIDLILQYLPEYNKNCIKLITSDKQENKVNVHIDGYLTIDELFKLAKTLKDNEKSICENNINFYRPKPVSSDYYSNW